MIELQIMNQIRLHIHVWAIALFVLLGTASCSRHDDVEPENKSVPDNTHLLIRARISTYGEMPRPESRVVDNIVDPYSTAWYDDTQGETFLRENNLLSDAENFIGNLRVFLLDASDNVIYMQSFQSERPDLTSGREEGLFRMDDEGNATLNMDLSPLQQRNLLREVRHLILVANQPYKEEDGGFRNLVTGSAPNFFPIQGNFFIYFGHKIMDNLILTEQDLLTMVNRNNKPFGLTMIGGIPINLSTPDNVARFNKLAVPINLYRNCAKMVVDVVNTRQTDAQKYNYYLGAEIQNVRTRIQLATPIFSERTDPPLWQNITGWRLLEYDRSDNQNTKKTTFRFPYLESGNYVVTKPDSVRPTIRYVYYTGVFDYRSTDNLPKIVFYTSTSDGLKYVKNEDGSDNMAALADRTYTMKLYGQGADLNRPMSQLEEGRLSKTYSNRINYYRLTFSGDRPTHYNVIFVPIGGEIHKNEAFIGDGTIDIRTN